jgi:hypothetical protein
MKKTILEDIARLAGLKQLDENYIYAQEDEAEDTAPDQIATDSKDSVDGEYDDESGMAKDQLETIERAAKELEDLLNGNENLPEWIQAKITKAQDYLSTATEVMKSRHEQGDVKTMEAAEKKADKDYDGDGEVESNKDEVWGSRAKAAAKSGKPFGKDKADEDRQVAEAIQRMKDIAGLK